jgi:hypothetical protein
MDTVWRCREARNQINPVGEFVITSPAFERTLRQDIAKLEGKYDGAITPLPTQIKANCFETRNLLAK